MKELKNVTLIGIVGENNLEKIELLQKCLIYSSKEITFNNIKMIAPLKPDILNDKIEYCKIDTMSLLEYQYFSIYRLNKYVDTEYVLTIHIDGFILNPDVWRDEFLEYDYIGAPWTTDNSYDGIRIGNSGFCLRSKKFLEISKTIKYTGSHDDKELCIIHRNIFIEAGCKYAPLEIAMQFSKECLIEIPFSEKTFGFHGFYDLDKDEIYKKLDI
jgi:Protein of unknown function (DUF5672)